MNTPYKIERRNGLLCKVFFCGWVYPIEQPVWEPVGCPKIQIEPGLIVSDELYDKAWEAIFGQIEKGEKG